MYCIETVLDSAASSYAFRRLFNACFISGVSCSASALLAF